MSDMIELSEWRNRIKDDVAISSVSYIDQVVLDTCIDVCQEAKVWIARLPGISVYKDRPVITLPVPEQALLAEIQVLKFNGRPIDQLIDTVLDLQDAGWETRTGNCAAGYIHLDTNTIRLVPIPNTEAPRALTGSIAYKPSREATAVPTFLFDRYLDLVVHGAKARLFGMTNKTWADPAQYNRHIAEYERLRNKAKGDGASRHSTRARRRVTPHYF